MVAAVRDGESQRAAARRFRVPRSTLQWWLERAGARELDDVEWRDRSSAPKRTRRVSPRTEDRVLRARKVLHKRSALGEFGAAAIRRYLLEHYGVAPAVRTIGRILVRRGALDGRIRVRRPAPPPGWYLPEVASREAELDSFDTVMGLVIKGGVEVEVLNVVSLHGGLVGSWPTTGVTARLTVKFLVEHWRQHGLPRYAQFDNDTRFQGAHQFADAFGRVTRLCLSLGVVPVFAPPRETGFQAAIESYNGRWQAKVWNRFRHRSVLDLQRRSAAYVTAVRDRHAARMDAAPNRRVFPKRWALDLDAPLRGHVVFIRRTNDEGAVELLGHRYRVDPSWVHRLVRADVDLTAQTITFHALRRRDPDSQPPLRQLQYLPPKRPFKNRGGGREVLALR